MFAGQESPQACHDDDDILIIPPLLGWAGLLLQDRQQGPKLAAAAKDSGRLRASILVLSRRTATTASTAINAAKQSAPLPKETVGGLEFRPVREGLRQRAARRGGQMGGRCSPDVGSAVDPPAGQRQTHFARYYFTSGGGGISICAGGKSAAEWMRLPALSTIFTVINIKSSLSLGGNRCPMCDAGTGNPPITTV
jgi:hypothetical protein